jgi:serine/threonine protein kinase
MGDISDVIGEGTYGCVHKPSLTCKDKEVDYKNKISKIMEKEDAKSEMKEYKVMNSIDKKKDYYLGKPIKCTVNDTYENVEAIKTCKNGKDFLKQLDKIALLVMKDGGVNLETFADELIDLPMNESNKERVELFWIEAHRIILGLKVFLDNGIMHHDLKPQNIVYNEKMNRLNFIDFGFMTTKEQIVTTSSSSKNHLSNYHWSFPLEMAFYNKRRYLKYARKSEAERIEYYNKIVDEFKASKSTPITKVLRTFFSFITNKDSSSEEYSIVLKLFLKDFYNMTVHNISDTKKYNTFIQKSTDTVDIYGVGIAFFYVFIHSTKFLNDYLIESFTELFYSMVCPDLEKRPDVNSLLTKYESILENSGLLLKYNKHFENHKLVKGPSVPGNVSSKIDSIKKEDILITKTEQQEVVMSKINICPEGKILNPITNRCIKNKTVKICPDGKVLNPKTNRCIKNKTAKICPPGKVLNPKTNRCIKNKL